MPSIPANLDIALVAFASIMSHILRVPAGQRWDILVVGRSRSGGKCEGGDHRLYHLYGRIGRKRVAGPAQLPTRCPIATRTQLKRRKRYAILYR
jgi:hypothetical protein